MTMMVSPCRGCEREKKDKICAASCEILIAFQEDLSDLGKSTNASRSKKWRKRHPEKWKKAINREQRRKTKELRVGYIKRLLKAQGVALTEDLIDIKREQVMLGRLIKQATKEVAGGPIRK